MTQDELKRLFLYAESEGGAGLHWRLPPPSMMRMSGMRAGADWDHGYRKVRVNGKYYYEHRLVFLLVHGWVPDQIDHINGDRSDNRISNLRPATQTQQNANMKMRKDNTSGVRGVCFHAQMGKWYARLSNKSLGLYDTLEEAQAAYEAAATDAWGDYYRKGEA